MDRETEGVENGQIHVSTLFCHLLTVENFLNQVRAWFLEITFISPKCVCVYVRACMRVCVHPRGHKKLVARF